MPDPYGPSEFGGKSNDLGIQPLPHQPDASEQLSLTYRTGDPTGLLPADPNIFVGLLPTEAQRALREAAGDLEKGQVWKAMIGE